MSVIRELGRRNVVKVAGIYVVVAWLLLQVTDVLTGMLPIPEWTGSLVFTLLLIGLPVVILFSWMFEVTPDGIKRDSGEGEIPTASSSRRVDALIVVLLVAVLATLLIDRFSPPEDDEAELAATSTEDADQDTEIIASNIDPDDFRIAVLPFVNLSQNADEDYLSVGISTQILNALSQVPGFRVSSQRSVNVLQDQNLSAQEIADLLGVQFVIDGSVFRAADQIRVSAQLVDVTNDVNVWTETYDKQADDLIQVQDDISGIIIEKLTKQAVANAGKAAPLPRFDDYDRFLRARDDLVSSDRMEEAAALLDRVIASDPNFVEALTLRASVEISLSDVQWGKRLHPLAEVTPRVKRWLDHAESIDPTSPDVLAASGLLYHAHNDMQAAVDKYRSALRQRPNWSGVRQRLAFIYGATGKIQEAIDQLRIAFRYDPANPDTNIALFDWSIMLHDLDGAKQVLDEWRRLDPDNIQQTYSRIRYLRFSGQLADSLALLEQFEKTEGLPEVMRTDLFMPKGEVLLALGEYERAQELSDTNPQYRIRALTLQGRYGEAVAIAKRWVDQDPGNRWPVDELLRALFYAKRWQEYIELYEDNIESETYFRDYYYFPAYQIAYAAYRTAAHAGAGRFEEFLRPVIDGSYDAETRKPEMDMILARLDVLLGREDEAIRKLQTSVDKFLYAPRIGVDPIFARLYDRADYHVILDQIENRMNDERRKLGLEPVTMIRRTPS